jgi:nanoRNase/pAp phosphatase (c-di-AMP/oligoRNAs hydrolase)
MRPLMRLEYEPKSCAIYRELFISESLREKTGSFLRVNKGIVDMPTSAAEKLRRLYACFAAENRVAILINADPDAISSAMALKRLLWRRVAKAVIVHINEIKRPDNLAMIRLFKVELSHIERIDMQPFSAFALLDSQPDHNPLFEQFAYKVVIDHHPQTQDLPPSADIRPDYGATASIMTEYLRAAKIEPSARLATALFCGIKTDTHNFEQNALIEDVRAFQYLFPRSNIHLAHKIEQSEITFDFLPTYRLAIERMTQRKGRIYVHLGPVTSPDICVLIADFFMKVHDVTWSIVSAIYGKDLIVILRNDGIRKNAGKVAERVFGKTGSAGGHESAARAEIPVNNLEGIIDTKDEKKLSRWIIQTIEK